MNKIIIFGLGLIGASIAKACKENHLASKICGYDVDEETIDFAIKNDIIDEIYAFSHKIDRDLVIIAAPLKKYREIASKIAKNCSPNTIICDAGSLKVFIEKDILHYFGKNATNFVACHPIAGSEKNTIKNSNSAIFLNKKVIITPFLNTNWQKIEEIGRFWHKICQNKAVINRKHLKIAQKTQKIDKNDGFFANLFKKVTKNAKNDQKNANLSENDAKSYHENESCLIVDPKTHDQIYALMSHLPQFLSFINKSKDHPFEIDTKIAHQHFRLEQSNHQIWDDIFDLNRKNLTFYINIYKKRQKFVQKALKTQNFDKIVELLTKTSKICDELGVFADISPKKLPIYNQNHLLARVLIVSCFVQIPNIKDYKSYAGSGFYDFVSILIYLKSFLEHKELIKEILPKTHI